MISSQIGYAMALLKTSIDLGVTARVYEEMPAIDELLTLHARYFQNPEVGADEKSKLLLELLEGKIEDLTMQFLVLITQRQKLRRFSGICRHFMKMAEEELGTVTVQLSTPYELREETIDRLRVHLEEAGLFTLKENGTVKFEITIDRSLLGGFVAESGRRVLDASLKTRLTRLARAK